MYLQLIPLSMASITNWSWYSFSLSTNVALESTSPQWSLTTQNVVLGHAALAFPGSLLEMQNTRLLSNLPDSAFKNIPRWFTCTSKYEKWWFRHYLKNINEMCVLPIPETHCKALSLVLSFPNAYLCTAWEQRWQADLIYPQEEF